MSGSRYQGKILDSYIQCKSLELGKVLGAVDFELGSFDMEQSIIQKCCANFMCDSK